MIKLREEGKKAPISNMLIVILLFIAFVSFPLESILKNFLSTDLSRYLSYILPRLLASILFITLTILYGFSHIFKRKPTLKSLLFALPLLVIAINNFPFFSLITGDVNFVSLDGYFSLYILAILLVALLEEVVFRGLVLSFFVIKFSSNNVENKGKIKNPYTLKVIFFSSLVFAVVHIVNLFGGASIGATLMQVGYSFLLGSALSLVMIKTQNIFVPVLIHFVYNFGGMLSKFGLIEGKTFTTLQIIMTAVIAIICGIIIVFAILKQDDEETKNSLNVNF